MGSPSNTLCYTIYADRNIGLTVTAWPDFARTRCWWVWFLRRSFDFDRIGYWMPGAGWDRSRLDPSALPLIPPAALAAVEEWLAGQAAVEVAP